ncbi:hypothetical protein PLANPX_4050 [Lacipirellula parvula]|uniref:Uncharacterized protein n=1 Tax=Lacipirellula parvula TaxID=2650471 RepID=A0A5K7XD89_9BACT|nr:hypothetical protein PLANPX_4050 [Lacipirellula parvula]
MTVNEQKVEALKWLLDGGGGNGVWINQLRKRWRIRTCKNPFSPKEWNRLVEAWGESARFKKTSQPLDLPFDPRGNRYTSQEFEELKRSYPLIKPAQLLDRYPLRARWSQDLSYWVENKLTLHYPVIEVWDDWKFNCHRLCPDEDEVISRVLMTLAMERSNKKVGREICKIYPALVRPGGIPSEQCERSAP